MAHPKLKDLLVVKILLSLLLREGKRGGVLNPKTKINFTQARTQEIHE